MMPSSAPPLSPVYKALKELYDSTSGEDWYDKNNWLMYTISWCNWYGVTCDETSKSITKISLRYNRLQGSIPASISNLLRLEWLDLDRNLLTGTIPTEVGLLSSLYRL